MSHQRVVFISGAVIALLAACGEEVTDDAPSGGAGGGSSGAPPGVGGSSAQAGSPISSGRAGMAGTQTAPGGTGNGGGPVAGAPAAGGSKAGGSAGTPPTNGGSPPQGGNAAGGSSAGAAPAGGSGGSGGSVTVPPVPCATPLAERAKVTTIDVTSKVVTKGSGINSANMPIILATSPDGRAKIAWTDGTNAHVTPLTTGDARQAPDITLPGSEVRGFVAHDDGSAILVRREDAMVFVRLDEAGTAKSTLSIVGGTSHTVEDSRWIDDWPHNGRLAWSGTQYGAYFGQTGNFGSQGNHQGDHYSLITAAGTLEAKGGWDWGCSHSLDVRLAHNGTAWAPVCAADTYPPTGFYFNNRTEISDEPTITNTGGTAKLGGLVPATDGFYLTFTSPTGRSSPDVGFLKFSNTGMPSGKVFLTDTAGVQESWAHLAKYGDRLLAGWAAGMELMIATIDTAGAIVEQPVAAPAAIGGQDDFATWANGDAGWAGIGASNMQLVVVRVVRCE
jgi:hypothetical protein